MAGLTEDAAFCCGVAGCRCRPHEMSPRGATVSRSSWLTMAAGILGLVVLVNTAIGQPNAGPTEPVPGFECLSGVTCNPGDPVCDDGDRCTADSCVLTGDPHCCVFLPILGCAAPCEEDEDCDDANECTDDTCVNNFCRHVPRTECRIHRVNAGNFLDAGEPLDLLPPPSNDDSTEQDVPELNRYLFNSVRSVNGDIYFFFGSRRIGTVAGRLTKELVWEFYGDRGWERTEGMRPRAIEGPLNKLTGRIRAFDAGTGDSEPTELVGVGGGLSRSGNGTATLLDAHVQPISFRLTEDRWELWRAGAVGNQDPFRASPIIRSTMAPAPTTTDALAFANEGNFDFTMGNVCASSQGTTRFGLAVGTAGRCPGANCDVSLVAARYAATAGESNWQRWSRCEATSTHCNASLHQCPDSEDTCSPCADGTCLCDPCEPGDLCPECSHCDGCQYRNRDHYLDSCPHCASPACHGSWTGNVDWPPSNSRCNADEVRESFILGHNAAFRVETPRISWLPQASGGTGEYLITFVYSRESDQTPKPRSLGAVRLRDLCQSDPDWQWWTRPSGDPESGEFAWRSEMDYCPNAAACAFPNDGGGAIVEVPEKYVLAVEHVPTGDGASVFLVAKDPSGLSELVELSYTSQAPAFARRTLVPAMPDCDTGTPGVNQAGGTSFVAAGVPQPAGGIMLAYTDPSRNAVFLATRGADAAADWQLDRTPIAVAQGSQLVPLGIQFVRNVANNVDCPVIFAARLDPNVGARLTGLALVEDPACAQLWGNEQPVQLGEFPPPVPDAIDQFERVGERRDNSVPMATYPGSWTNISPPAQMTVDSDGYVYAPALPYAGTMVHRPFDGQDSPNCHETNCAFGCVPALKEDCSSGIDACQCPNGPWISDPGGEGHCGTGCVLEGSECAPGHQYGAPPVHAWGDEFAQPSKAYATFPQGVDLLEYQVNGHEWRKYLFVAQRNIDGTRDLTVDVWNLKELDNAVSALTHSGDDARRRNLRECPQCGLCPPELQWYAPALTESIVQRNATTETTAAEDVAVFSGSDYACLYVTDSIENQVDVYSLSINDTDPPCDVTLSYADGVPGFKLPMGIDVDGEGNVYVADSGNHQVVRCVPTSDPSDDPCRIDCAAPGSWQSGGYGVLPGAFVHPVGVAVDAPIDPHADPHCRTNLPRSWVYVTDPHNERVQVLDANDGSFALQFRAEPWGDHIGDSTGIAVGPDRDLYLGVGGAVERLRPRCPPDPGGGPAAAEPGPPDPQPAPVDCDHDGLDDRLEIRNGRAKDCNGNQIPDGCEVLEHPGIDCNHNFVPDLCDFGDGVLHPGWNGTPVECQAPPPGTLYVRAPDSGAGGCASVAGAGNDWTNPHTCLTEALQRASEQPGVREIRVAGGTYDLASERSDCSSSCATGCSFSVPSGVTLSGGYDPGCTLAECERNPAVYVTRLRGCTSDSPEAPIITIQGAECVTVDGFEIADGHGPGGGGLSAIFVDNLVVRNCVFRGNVSGSLFFNVFVPRPGGAVSLSHGSAEFRNCLFDSNSASLGGAIYSDQTLLKVVGCTIVGNEATSEGGGIYVRTPACDTVTVQNSVLWGNWGRGVDSVSAQISLRCTGHLADCGDICPCVGGCTRCDIGRRVTHSLLPALTEGCFPGEGNIPTDDPGLAPDFHPRSDSVCIDRANPLYVYADEKDLGWGLRRGHAPPGTDCAGEPPPPDIGAYEYHGCYIVDCGASESADCGTSDGRCISLNTPDCDGTTSCACAGNEPCRCTCTCMGCSFGDCTPLDAAFGNVDCSQEPQGPNLDDILCVLAGFATFSTCISGDIAPTTGPQGCQGNDIIDLDDIMVVVAAFSGQDSCDCP